MPVRAIVAAEAFKKLRRLGKPGGSVIVLLLPERWDVITLS